MNTSSWIGQIHIILPLHMSFKFEGHKNLINAATKISATVEHFASEKTRFLSFATIELFICTATIELLLLNASCFLLSSLVMDIAMLEKMWSNPIN